jgi:hypothetical protein
MQVGSATLPLEYNLSTEEAERSIRTSTRGAVKEQSEREENAEMRTMKRIYLYIISKL